MVVSLAVSALTGEYEPKGDVDPACSGVSMFSGWNE